MPFLNLRRLLPPRKVWKVITSKLQFKLHKLNKSKAIKKHKIRASKKHSWPKPTLSIQPKKFKRKKHAYSHTTLGYQCHSLCRLQQRKTPVYVDKLFIQPISIVKEQAVEENKEKCSSSSFKNSEISDYNQKKNYSPESRKEEGNMADNNQNVHAADDMWESMVMASPQMNEINERAEEFIAKFRAEMQEQEILARRL